MEITVTHVDLKDKNIVFGVGKDITERKKAEIEILSSLEEKELLSGRYIIGLKIISR